MMLGTITNVSRNVGVAVQIDGETAPTTKKYMWVVPYYPKTGDRVLIEEISGTYVILGKVTNNYRNDEVYKSVYLKNNSGNADPGADLITFSYVGGTLWYGYCTPGGSITWHTLP